MFDLLIKHGRVIDGTGNPWFRADVAIKDDRIVAVRRQIESEAARVIDASSMVVSPGFIDVHTHSDRTALSHKYAHSSVYQGVTCEGVGQCGSSMFPLTDSNRDATKRMLTLFSQKDEKEAPDVTWTSLSEWRDTVSANGISINLAPFVGHGTIRTCVMGAEGKGGEKVHPLPSQLDEMKAHVAKAMQQGAFGLSTGLRYAPGRNATTQEVIELCKVVVKYGGAHISHMRSEEEVLNSAVREVIEISEKSGVTSSITHHKAMFPENWGKPHETLRMMDRARERGVEVVCDQYPWLYSSQSNLGSYFFAVAPKPATGKPDMHYVLECMKDNDTWANMRAALHRSYENEVRVNEDRKRQLQPYGIMVPDIWNPAVMKHVVHSKTHPEVLWMNLGEVGLAKGTDYWDALRAIYLDDEGATYLGGGDMSEEDLITIMKHPYTSVSTDSWILNDFPSMMDPHMSPHPRNYGSFPVVLERYVRELKVLSLENAVRKMTGLPAQFLGLRDRGVLREGAMADIVVFDPNKVTNNATFSEPRRHPSGIPYVIVNGMTTIDQGKHTGALSGRVLRHNG